MTDFIIKKASSRLEIEEISNLARKVWSEHYASLLGIDQIEYMLSKYQSADVICDDIENNSYIYYTAFDGKELVGYCAVKPEPEKKSIFMSKIYIDKSRRGRGLLKKFMKQFVSDLKDNDFKTIWLTVNKGNKSSIAVYGKIGFKNIDSIKSDIGNNFYMDDYIMEYDIKNLYEERR